MKPIKLTMTAFGPYRDKEVINFEQLEDHRLFVISGKTGAGKTTIFDAISFALYGQASGEDRQDVKMLRSHFSDDDLHTSVELIFELKGKKYRVFRQLGHIKEGNKSPTGEKYEFFEITDSGEVPSVDRQIKSEIDKKIEELIGLTKDQFSQIVMLPQGEFRKLLTSKTENKEEILRRIFNTYPYQKLNEKLNEKRKQAELNFSAVKDERDRLIGEIQSKLPAREESVLFQTLKQEHYNTKQILEGLELERHYYDSYVKEAELHKDKASSLFKEKQELYHQAKVLNDSFLELERLENDMQRLNDQKEDMAKREQRLEMSERANRLTVYEKQVLSWRDEVNKKEELSKQLNVKFEESEKEFRLAKEAYDEEEKKKEERDQVNVELNRYIDLVPKVKDLNKKLQEVKISEENVKKAKEDYETIKNNHDQQHTEQKKLSEKIKELTEITDTYHDEDNKLKSMREQATMMKDYIDLKNKESMLSNQLFDAEKTFKEIQKYYQQKEQAWFKGQASILASHLHDGEHCPVCGSIHHPNKAKPTSDIPSKEELERIKNQLDEKEQIYKNLLADKNAIINQLKDKENDLLTFEIDPENIEEAFDELVLEGKELKNKVEELKQKKEKLEQLKVKYEKIEQQTTEMQAKLEDAQQILNDAERKFYSQKAVYEEVVKLVPEDVRNLNLLNAKVDELKQKKFELEEKWQGVQNRLEECKQKYTETKTNRENALKQLEEAKLKLSEAEKEFNQSLEKADFESEEQYRQAKLTEEEQEQLKVELDKYKQALLTTSNRLNQLKEQLKGKEMVDLEQFEQQMQEAQANYEQALDYFKEVQRYRLEVENLIKSINEASQKVEQYERKFSIITELYNVVRGQNELKISFERYLQIEYLEQIVEAANERLKRLSNGQYYLKRSNRQESHGKQSGLGLDVYDAYTGQDRDVKSLSGGEKFNASLSLALGMSDVIQSYQGGVSIDTMFIDEGFGSLDDESLSKAIDTLIELQKSGRIIGVISHVQELKTAIPAILQVDKTKEGYSQTEFIIR